MKRSAILLASATALLISAPSRADDEGPVRDGRIGYAMISLFWANYQTPDAKEECPQGLNTMGPRETFKALFPQDKGQQWTEVESHLKREIAGWFPKDDDPFPYLEASGKISLGLNLDGKIGPNDFTSPEGEKGIDNQMFRALGCAPHYRLPDGQTIFFDSQHIVTDGYNRTLLELNGVDSLTNDDSVDITVYRGRDRLLTDATGNTIMPGGSQRLDLKRGKRFIQHLHGKITNGVLETQPADVVIPWSTFGTPTVQIIKAMRVRLKLTPQGAEGLIAGYVDLDNWYSQLMKSESTHHEAYGQLSPPGLHGVLERLVDAYPDPKTGKNTAISSALTVKFTQVFIVHPKDDPSVTASREKVIQQAGEQH